MIDKNLILINYLQTLSTGYTFKSEYSTNDEDLKVVVVSQRPTEKVVLYCGKKLFEAFQIEIFGDSIRDEKELANINCIIKKKMEKLIPGVNIWY